MNDEFKAIFGRLKLKQVEDPNELNSLEVYDLYGSDIRQALEQAYYTGRNEKMADSIEPELNAFIPCDEMKNFEGRNWLKFSYSNSDIAPHKWPKVLKYNGMFFKWMSYNSDYSYICYRQVFEFEIATQF